MSSMCFCVDRTREWAGRRRCPGADGEDVSIAAGDFFVYYLFGKKK